MALFTLQGKSVSCVQCWDVMEYKYCEYIFGMQKLSYLYSLQDTIRHLVAVQQDFNRQRLRERCYGGLIILAKHNAQAFYYFMSY